MDFSQLQHLMCTKYLYSEGQHLLKV